MGKKSNKKTKNFKSDIPTVSSAIETEASEERISKVDQDDNYALAIQMNIEKELVHSDSKLSKRTKFDEFFEINNCQETESIEDNRIDDLDLDHLNALIDSDHKFIEEKNLEESLRINERIQEYTLQNEEFPIHHKEKLDEHPDFELNDETLSFHFIGASGSNSPEESSHECSEKKFSPLIDEIKVICEDSKPNEHDLHNGTIMKIISLMNEPERMHEEINSEELSAKEKTFSRLIKSTIETSEHCSLVEKSHKEGDSVLAEESREIDEELKSEVASTKENPISHFFVSTNNNDSPIENSYPESEHSSFSLIKESEEEREDFKPEITAKEKIFSHLIKYTIETHPPPADDLDPETDMNSYPIEAYDRGIYNYPLVDLPASYNAFEHTEDKECPSVNRGKEHLCKFSIKYETKFGERIIIVGSTLDLGTWDPFNGFKLNWEPSHIWSGVLKCTTVPFEYKYVCLSSSHAIWEKGKNREFDHFESEKSDNWQAI